MDTSRLRSCFGDTDQDSPYHYIYRWGIRHIILEFILCLIALAIGALWIFFCSFISLCGASITTCCCLSYSGWRICLTIQSSVTFVRFIYFVLVCIGLASIKNGRIYVVLSLICIIVSTLSVVPFLLHSRYHLQSMGVVPINEEHITTTGVIQPHRSGTIFYDDGQYHNQNGYYGQQNIIEVQAIPMQIFHEHDHGEPMDRSHAPGVPVYISPEYVAVENPYSNHQPVVVTAQNLHSLQNRQDFVH